MPGRYPRPAEPPFCGKSGPGEEISTAATPDFFGPFPGQVDGRKRGCPCASSAAPVTSLLRASNTARSRTLPNSVVLNAPSSRARLAACRRCRPAEGRLFAFFNQPPKQQPMVARDGGLRPQPRHPGGEKFARADRVGIVSPREQCSQLLGRRSVPECGNIVPEASIQRRCSRRVSLCASPGSPASYRPVLGILGPVGDLSGVKSSFLQGPMWAHSSATLAHTAQRFTP